MSRALATIALLILSNTFMTLAWYGHIAFKSKIERFGMLSIILLSWGIALFAEQRYRRVRRHGTLPRRSFGGNGFDRL